LPRVTQVGGRKECSLLLLQRDFRTPTRPQARLVLIPFWYISAQIFLLCCLCIRSVLSREEGRKGIPSGEKWHKRVSGAKELEVFRKQ
jgi:hypothetical protein